MLSVKDKSRPCSFSPPAEGDKDIKQIQEDLQQEKKALQNDITLQQEKKALQSDITLRYHGNLNRSGHSGCGGVRGMAKTKPLIAMLSLR